MKRYKLIGLTGTTGAGKGETRKIFKRFGYAVIDADLLARKIMEQSEVLEGLKRCFGEDIVKDGVLDRRLLAGRAFRDKESSQLLNRLTHPFIISLFIRELKRLSDSNNDRIVFDAPQLFESGLDVICDLTVAVTADEELRIKRVCERDKISADEARARVNAQFSPEFFAENCDYVIDNSLGLEELEARTKEIIKLIEV